MADSDTTQNVTDDASETTKKVGEPNKPPYKKQRMDNNTFSDYEFETITALKASINDLVQTQIESNKEFQQFREFSQQRHEEAKATAKEENQRLQVQLATLSSQTKDRTQLEADATLCSLLPTLPDSVENKFTNGKTVALTDMKRSFRPANLQGRASGHTIDKICITKIQAKKEAFTSSADVIRTFLAVFAFLYN